MWEAIDTAPKDGSQILAFAHDPDLPERGYYAVAQWANADPDFPNTVSGWFWTYAIRPTHWMELPAPPPAA